MNDSEMSITMVRTIQASAEDLYTAWTDPKLFQRWMSSGDFQAKVVEIDACVGGRYRFEIAGPSGERHITTGEYRELIPGRRLVKTWVYEGAIEQFRGAETVLTVDFRPLDAESTELTLRHERLPSQEYRDSVQ